MLEWFLNGANASHASFGDLERMEEQCRLTETLYVLLRWLVVAASPIIEDEVSCELFETLEFCASVFISFLQFVGNPA